MTAGPADPTRAPPVAAKTAAAPGGPPPDAGGPAPAPTRGGVRRARRVLRRVVRWAFAGVVLVLALIGFLFITRGTAVQQVRGVGADGRPVAPAEPEFALSVAVLTGTVLSGGNRVELALNGDETFPRLWADLRAAERSVTVQMYFGGAGRVADTLRAILMGRARAGVRVLVLYDAFGMQAPTPEHREAMQRAGVVVVPFRPLRLATLYRVQNRSHVRGIVIDGRVAWTGGFGVDDKWLGGGLRPDEWRETNVRFEGPAVRQLQSAFAAAWTEATGTLLTGRQTVDRYADGVATAGLLYASPTLGSTAAERFLALSIAGARRTLYVTNAYFAPDENILALLVEAARRGVDVRLLVGGAGTDVRLAWAAGRGRYETLLAAGVRIYEWLPSTLHAKTMVVDGLWSSVGTMNFDNRSLALNDEVTLMVLDAAAGARMDAVFRDDLRHAREVTLVNFRRRPWTDRVTEWLANLLTRVL